MLYEDAAPPLVPDIDSFWAGPPLLHMGLFKAMAREGTVPDVAELCLDTLTETGDLAQALACLLRQAQRRLPARVQRSLDQTLNALTNRTSARLLA